MSGDYWTELSKARLSRRRAIGAAGAAGLGAVMLAACGGSDSGGSKDARRSEVFPGAQGEDTTKQAKRGGVMKTYWDADISDYDVHNTRNAGQNIPNFTYSRFVQIKPGFLQPTEWEVVGDMAESWEWSPDGLTLSMKLRQGAGWAPLAPVNGRAVTIEDIAYTWKRWIERGSNRGDYLNSLDPDSPVLSMNTTDARTFVFKLAFPMVGLLGMMASNIKQSYILPTRPTASTRSAARRSAPGRTTSATTAAPSAGR